MVVSRGLWRRPRLFPQDHSRGAENTLSSPVSHRLKEDWGLSGFICWQGTLETEINQ